VLEEVKLLVESDCSSKSFDLSEYKSEGQSSVSNPLKQKIMNKVQALYPGVNVEYTKTKPTIKIKKGKKFKVGESVVTATVEGIILIIISLENKTDKDFEDYVNQIYHKEMGFSLVIEELIKAQVPLIGHNLIYDIGFLYDQFIAPLPNSFIEFAQKWRECFPVTYDTKTIALLSELKLFRRTDLASLYRQCRKDETLRNCIDYSVDGYEDDLDFFNNKSESSCAHEAGFDALMTGIAFMCMSKHKEMLETIKQNTHKGKKKPKKSKPEEDTK